MPGICYLYWKWLSPWKFLERTESSLQSFTVDFIVIHWVLWEGHSREEFLALEVFRSPGFTCMKVVKGSGSSSRSMAARIISLVLLSILVFGLPRSYLFPLIWCDLIGCGEIGVVLGLTRVSVLLLRRLLVVPQRTIRVRTMLSCRTSTFVVVPCTLRDQ